MGIIILHHSRMNLSGKWRKSEKIINLEEHSKGGGMDKILTVPELAVVGKICFPHHYRIDVDILKQIELYSN